MFRAFTSTRLSTTLGRTVLARTLSTARIERVLAVKAAANKSFDDIANALGVTNTYAAQLLLGQAQLSPETASKLQQVLPDLSDQDLQDVQQAPMRSWDDEILKEPNVYRTYEAVTHYGEAIKRIINEQCGDGIMSAIDFYCDVGTTTGIKGEKRVVITFNGKFLPFIEQRSDENTARVQETKDASVSNKLASVSHV